MQVQGDDCVILLKALERSGLPLASSCSDQQQQSSADNQRRFIDALQCTTLVDRATGATPM